jgi:hypothetical protein
MRLQNEIHGTEVLLFPGESLSLSMSFFVLSLFLCHSLYRAYVSIYLLLVSCTESLNGKCTQGPPQSIVTDRGMVFTSHMWQDIFKLMGVKLKLSSASTK